MSRVKARALVLMAVVLWVRVSCEKALRLVFQRTNASIVDLLASLQARGDGDVVTHPHIGEYVRTLEIGTPWQEFRIYLDSSRRVRVAE
jgi:hypothetical protein